MALLLWIASGVILLTGQPVLAGIIWLVVLSNAAFAFWRETRTSKTISSLGTLLPATARVLREGQDRLVPANELVPGDLLFLAEGDQIPADARVVEEYGLRVNQASLTGEAVPVRKNAQASYRDDLTEIEQTNLVFAGSTVISGTCRAVVSATGILTQFGRIANLAQTVPEPPSRLQLELTRLSRIFAIVAVFIGAIVWIVAQTDVGLDYYDALILSIGIFVAVVPVGLNPTLTMALAMSTQRLAKHGVLVKKLSILEPLATTSVICTDKSGTLTQNQMTVRKLWLNGQIFNVTGIGYEPIGEITNSADIPAYTLINSTHPAAQFFLACHLCNNARIISPTTERARWTSLGDQTEAALLVLAKKWDKDIHRRADAYPRIHELPFDARRKRMSTIHHERGREIAFIKGSPKEVLQLCTSIAIDTQVIPLSDQIRAEILSANDKFARQALRVLALASRNLPGRQGEYLQENVERDLVFLGLAAMMDPPRAEVSRAIEAFRSAGIRTVMITGDYGLTAESLARRVGLVTGPSPQIITGADLDLLEDQQLISLLDSETIFARMAPEHKLRLVSAFQSRGDIVSVIGDGVNDVPALRKADIGIAMGVTGTAVASDAADVVLIHDNFEALVEAIKEGRSVYVNLRKFITYIFTSSVAEVLPFIMTALFRIPLALSVIQILAIDLGTNILPSLALGVEKPEPDTMQQPPRSPAQPLINKSILYRAFLWLGPLEAFLSYLGFFLVLTVNSGKMSLPPNFEQLFLIPPGNLSEQPVLLVAATAFFAGLVTSQVGNAFACRSERKNVRWLGIFSNPSLILAILVQMIFVFALIYIPPIRNAFGLQPLPPIYWSWLLMFAPILYGLERIRKFIFLHFSISKNGGST